MAGPSSSAGSAPVASPGGGNHTSDSLAHNVATRFRDLRAKCPGASKQVWYEYEAEYQSMSRYCGLTSDQRYMYPHNMLAGDAKRYYLNTV